MKAFLVSQRLPHRPFPTLLNNIRSVMFRSFLSLSYSHDLFLYRQPCFLSHIKTRVNPASIFSASHPHPAKVFFMENICQTHHRPSSEKAAYDQLHC